MADTKTPFKKFIDTLNDLKIDKASDLEQEQYAKYFKIDSFDYVLSKTANQPDTTKIDDNQTVSIQIDDVNNSNQTGGASEKDIVDACIKVFSTKFNVHQWHMDMSRSYKQLENKELSPSLDDKYESSKIKFNLTGGDKKDEYAAKQKDTLQKIVYIIMNISKPFEFIDLLMVANVHYTFAKVMIKSIEKQGDINLSKEEVVKKIADKKFKLYCDKPVTEENFYIHYAHFVARKLGIKKTETTETNNTEYVLKTLKDIKSEGENKQLLVSIWYLIADKIKAMTKFNFDYSKPEFKFEAKLDPIDIRSFVNNRTPSMKAVNDATQFAASAFISDHFQQKFPGAQVVKTVLGQQVGGAPNPNGANLFKTIFERLQSMLKSKQMTMHTADVKKINEKIETLERLENTLKEILGNMATFVSGDYPQYKHDEVNYETMKQEADKYNAALADYNSTTAKIMKFFTKINTILISQ